MRHTQHGAGRFDSPFPSADGDEKDSEADFNAIIPARERGETRIRSHPAFNFDADRPRPSPTATDPAEAAATALAAIFPRCPYPLGHAAFGWCRFLLRPPVTATWHEACPRSALARRGWRETCRRTPAPDTPRASRRGRRILRPIHRFPAREVQSTISPGASRPDDEIQSNRREPVEGV